MADEARRYYGVQFHPEVVHTPRRREADLRNFVAQDRGLQGRLDDGRFPRARRSPRSARRSARAR
ncbi:MAG: hypothetical protein QM722_00505 [Piscinibacter sp.]